METSSAAYEGVVVQPHSDAALGQHDVAILGQPPAPSKLAIRQEIVVGGVSPQSPVNVANVLRLLESQQYRCALTGRSLTPDMASLDHIIPVRCGGEHLVENTQVLHKDVNRAKTTMTNEEFIQLCREVVEHTAYGKIEGETLNSERNSHVGFYPS